MTKSCLAMSLQVMILGSIILSPSDRLPIESGPLNKANAQYLSAKKVLHASGSDFRLYEDSDLKTYQLMRW